MVRSDDSPGVRLARLVGEARRVVVFTGAGISTESGIPDFRSPGGLWSRYQPIPFDEFMASEETRIEAWRRKIALDEAIGDVRPNQGHLAIAELARDGKVTWVITQNIDGLHQAAGVAGERVIEIHGSGRYAKCLACGRRHELAPIFADFKLDAKAPRCEGCGGIVKTATISFGQAMPEREMALAEAAALDCDLFLAIGSSLVVYPAATLPQIAKRAGARLVILNREATPLDSLADLLIRAEIGPTLGQLRESTGGLD